MTDVNFVEYGDVGLSLIYISVAWVQTCESHYSAELSWLILLVWHLDIKQQFLGWKSDQSNERHRVSNGIVKLLSSVAKLCTVTIKE